MTHCVLQITSHFLTVRNTHILTPKPRAKGKFHYPTAGLFSANLKMKIEIFFLLEIVRNDVNKSTKCNYFPFVSILRELAATWKSAMHRGERWQNEGLEALKRLFMNEYGSVSFCHTLVTYFQWLRHYCSVSAEMKRGKWYCVYKPHLAVNMRGFINPIRCLGVKKSSCTLSEGQKDHCALGFFSAHYISNT